MPLPIPRPISGKRFAPKIRMMMKRMMISSGRPTRPSMAKPFVCRCLPDSTTSSESWRLRVLSLALAAVLGMAVVSGRTPQFTSGVNVVEVYAAVSDRDGKPVTGLTREDFTVVEDGQPQTISTFTEGDFPLSVAVAVDRSFSMTNRIALEQSAAQTFLEALRPSDESMLVTIGSEVETAAPLSTD